MAKGGESIWNRSLAFLRIFCAILLCYDIIIRFLQNLINSRTKDGSYLKKMSRIHTRQKPLSYCFSKRNV